MRYQKSPDFPFLEEKLKSVLNGPPIMYHAQLTPHPPDAAFNAPVLELFTVYLPASISEEEKEKWYHNFKNFMEQLIVDAEGLVAEAHGWVLEEVEHGKDNAKCKAFLCGIGWESVDNHMGHRGTESFKSSIGLLQEGALSHEMHHVVFHGDQS